METNLLILGMNHRIVKKDDIKIIPRGRKSSLSYLRADLFKLKPGERIEIKTAPHEQRIVSRRMRTNIQHWKRRHGLRSITVNLTQDGNVALEVAIPKKRKGGRVVYGGGLENR